MPLNGCNYSTRWKGVSRATLYKMEFELPSSFKVPRYKPRYLLLRKFHVNIGKNVLNYHGQHTLVNTNNRGKKISHF